MVTYAKNLIQKGEAQRCSWGMQKKATLPGAWHYRVSAGTGWPGVSMLWLGEMQSFIHNFYLSVAAHTTVWVDPSLRYTSMLLGR